MLEMGPLYDLFEPKVLLASEGQPRVLARTPDGKELVGHWWDAKPMPRLNMDGARHIDIELPDCPGGASAHVWLARHTDGKTLGGTGGVSVYHVPSPQFSFTPSATGLTLRLGWDGGASKTYSFVWV